MMKTMKKKSSTLTSPRNFRSFNSNKKDLAIRLSNKDDSNNKSRKMMRVRTIKREKRMKR
jgi:hypothetical protein